MTEASYRAWDDNLYEWPPPDGWYQAPDGKWWPDGYGPGGQAATAAADPSDTRSGETGGVPSDSAGNATSTGFDPGKTSVLPAGATAGDDPGGGTTPADSGFDPARTSVLPAGSPTGGSGSAGSGSSGFDPERTSTFPAGTDDDLSDLTFQPRTPEQRLAEEARRRAYDELPSIDDVFFGGGGGDEGPVRAAPDDLSLDDIPGLGIDPEVTTPPPPPSTPAAPPRTEPPPGPAPVPDGSPVGRSGAAPVDEPAGPSPAPTGAGGSAAPEAVPPAPPTVGPVPAGQGGAPSRPPAPPAFGEETVPYDPFSGGPDETGYRGPGGAATVAVPGEVLSGLVDAGQGAPTSPDRVDPDPSWASGNDRSAAPVADIGSRWRVGEGAGRPQEPPPHHEQPPHQDQGWQRHHDERDEGRAVSGPLGGYDEQGGEDDRGVGYGRAVDADNVELESSSRGGLLLVFVAIAVIVAIGVVALTVFRDSDDRADGDGGDPTVEGGLANPYGFGTAVVVYYEGATGEELRWVVRVVEPVDDATQRLISEAAAPQPADGDLYAVARVEVTYQSGPEQAAATDLVIGAATADGTRLTTSEDGCPTVPDALDLGIAFSPTNSTTGNLCWVTGEDSLEGMVLTIEAGPAEGTVHLALTGAPAAEADDGE